jgi:hypothetical protein
VLIGAYRAATGRRGRWTDGVVCVTESTESKVSLTETRALMAAEQVVEGAEHRRQRQPQKLKGGQEVQKGEAEGSEGRGLMSIAYAEDMSTSSARDSACGNPSW